MNYSSLLAAISRARVNGFLFAFKMNAFFHDIDIFLLITRARALLMRRTSVNLLLLKRKKLAVSKRKSRYASVFLEHLVSQRRNNTPQRDESRGR